MKTFFNKIEVIKYNNDLFRNIKSIRQTQNLYDDLSENARDWQHAKLVEINTKPNKHLENSIIDRPFEEAIFTQAVHYPFEPSHWRASRYSKGDFGVWYGALELETTIYETVYHWHYNFLQAAQFKKLPSRIIGERRVCKIFCDALLLEFRKKIKAFPGLIDKNDYTLTQAIGEYIYQQGHPGLLSKSARCEGTISAIFTPKVLNNPRDYCCLTYSLDTSTQKVTVEKDTDEILLML